MAIKRIVQLIVVVAILVASFASTGGVLARSGCASYITVQWGDTLSGLAVLCGTSVEAIRAVNPGLGYWVYAGQVLCIPTGYTSSAPVYYPTYGSTYIVQWGDTLGIIAARFGVSVGDILAVNPQIWNPSLIYTGQVINLPVSIGVPATTYPPLPTNYPSDYPSSTIPSGPATLKVTYNKGLLIRSGPGKDYNIILHSAVHQTVWPYNIYTVTVDPKGNVWAEVIIDPLQNGYASGWVLVKDNLGGYFTDPRIDG